MMLGSLTPPLAASERPSQEETKTCVDEHPPPMSTTKALLLSIAVPRVYRVYIPPPTNPADDDASKKTEEDAAVPTPADDGGGAPASRERLMTSETQNTRGTAGSNALPAEPVIVNISTRQHSETMLEHDIGYVELDETEAGKTGMVEDIVTAEEMAAIVKLDPESEAPSAAGSVADKEGTQESEAGGEKGEEASVSGNTITSAIKNFFGVINKNAEETKKSYLNREDAIAAIKEYEPPLVEEDVVANTEIKVEELLKLTFRNLYAEGHFYNAPVYTAITSRLKDGDPDDWVEVAVMVKDPSIGIILERLERIGVGSSVGTIAIFKAELCKSVGVKNPFAEVEKAAAAVAEAAGEGDADAAIAEKTAASLEAARAEWKNAASRLRVEQVKEQIHEQAKLSFDYLSLLFIASLLAGIGLIVNSVVVIVASMLVSPIMGPVLGMTFGTRVLDWELARFSFFHECLSLLGCVAVGLVIGLTASWSEIAADWPTEEMASRGDVIGLITGIAIAIPSGMGVALSILGNNTSSLVGVAISASLLPPAVNTGVCWAHGFLIGVGAVDSNQDASFLRIGGISFALTVVNIVCIWFAGIAMFTRKEVAPSKSKSAFWARDIKVARAIQQGSKGVDMDVLKAGLQDALEKQGKGKKPTEEKGPRRRDQQTRKKRPTNKNFTFNMATNPLADGGMVDLKEFAGPTPLTDDIQYAGLEDMANLLGFDEEEDDDEERPQQSGGGLFRRRKD